MAVWRLNKNVLAFPDPHYGDEDGLIAVGGDLRPSVACLQQWHLPLVWLQGK